jgi:hypothetical protein
MTTKTKKTNLKKSQITPKQKIVKEQEKPPVIDTLFTLEELTLKKKERRFKFHIDETLKRSYRYYSVRLYFNVQPFKDKIEAILARIAEMKADQTLFDATEEGDQAKEQRIEQLEKERDEVKSNWKHWELNLPDYNFTGQSEKVEYNSDTLTFLIRQDDMAFFNSHFENLGYYKIELTPITA